MARLLSVNVGMPKDVSWHGRTVHTGIWKTPVAGPVMARRLNLEGDGQGDLTGHGGEQRAVLVYQADSLAYWRTHLGRDGSAPADSAQDFGFGAFGENFTVEGLADAEVCIGDRYRIGQAEFEVTQPRVTCYRLGLRLDTPELPSLLVQHGRPGFYLRVITEGLVRAGDEIVRTRRGRHELTVAEIDALLYLPGTDRDKLEAAVDIPALSPGWRQSFQDLLHESVQSDARTAAQAIGTEPGWNGFRPLRVEAVVPESSTITSISLVAQDGAALPAALPGQYLTVRIPQAGDPPPIRSYSLSSPPGSRAYRISVKREGLVSGYLHTKIHAGARIDAAAPRGEFVLAPGNEPVLLISAGVGITPVLAMLHELAAERSERDIWWLHTARNAEQQAFAQETHALLGTLHRAHEFVFHTAPDTAAPDTAAPQTLPARVTHARLSPQTLAGLGLPPDACAYVCGPEQFMTSVTEALVDLGIDRTSIHTEPFGTLASINPGLTPAVQVPPHPPVGEPGTGPLVTFARSGLAVPWNEATAPSLLELAEACDVPTRWSCRTGVCHTCVTTILSGEAVYRPDPLDPPRPGRLLVCCARPTTDVVLDM
ncbi:MOSC and FAD-binding oxidoreductase domain-containing protein [Kitasatospora kifunensis]|uniref:Ferredoxin-NADP reductase/MOSC domain-containing protein YiiM n=1 Tax=Kitasatospora kifunensis TaxID=58351 RepID=A0A7W7RAU7_KITKI|nr:MOSC and FAD-binding oxidoreductase domain-containing protein [Kitasatospora kifunensis]MBB4928519.1 ferredoxin-NADP reductase/MOSC domain-containing protein YiiM [Kitasatospora kifunensis]